MAYTAAIKLTRKSKTRPFFGEWISAQPKSAAKTAYTTLVQARARAGFKQSLAPEADDLTLIQRIEYGSEAVFNAFTSKYSAEMDLVKDARADYETTAGMTRSFTIET